MYALRSPALAHRHLQQLVSAVLLASADTDSRDATPAWRTAMDSMATRAREAYRGLVHGTPGFVDFWHQATPIDEIGRLRLGSRPAARRAGALTPDTVRAIPWVFSWMQSRFNLPGWYGLGTALAPVERGLLQEMYAAWPFYRALLDNAEMSLLKADMGIAALFHQISRYPRTPFRIWPDDLRALWTDASAQDELVQAWTDLARHFKGVNGVLFNLLTEPFWWKNEVTTPQLVQIWNVLYPRLVQAIRAEDPQRWIVVEPAFALDYFGDLTVSTDARVIYEFHHYDHEFTCQGCDYVPSPAGSVAYPGPITDLETGGALFLDKALITQRLRPAIEFRNAHKVRVIAGEFGSSYLAPMDSRVRYTADVIDVLEAHGFDWAYFTYDAMNWPELNDFGPWDFEGTPIEPVVTSRFTLNLR